MKKNQSFQNFLAEHIFNLPGKIIQNFLFSNTSGFDRSE